MQTHLQLILVITLSMVEFDVTNLPEGLDIIGQEVKPVNVGVWIAEA